MHGFLHLVCPTSENLLTLCLIVPMSIAVGTRGICDVSFVFLVLTQSRQGSKRLGSGASQNGQLTREEYLSCTDLLRAARASGFESVSLTSTTFPSLMPRELSGSTDTMESELSSSTIFTLKYHSPISSGSQTGSACKTLSKAGLLVTAPTSSSSPATITQPPGTQTQHRSSSQRSSRGVSFGSSPSDPTQSQSVKPCPLPFSVLTGLPSLVKKSGPKTLKRTESVRVLPSRVICTPNLADEEWAQEHIRTCQAAPAECDDCKKVGAIFERM